MPSSIDILTIGDAMLDVFLQLKEADVRCDENDENCALCLSFADKIPVEGITQVAGAGNASNNAVGSARLGMKAAIYSILGNDDTAKTIVKHWKNEGVGTAMVMFDKKQPTNYSTVLNYHGERTILIYHEKRDYVFPKNAPRAKWVYLTSMGEGSECIHPQLTAYLDRTGAKFAFQPGTFQLRLGYPMLKQLIARAEVLVVNKDEAEGLLGDGDKTIRQLLEEFHSAGCAIPVITDGPKGSYAYDGRHMYEMDIFDAPIVERTGAGDAFATAFVAALHFGKSVGDALRWGTANSTSVIGTIGPQEGLLTRKQLTAMMRRFPDVIAKRD